MQLIGKLCILGSDSSLIWLDLYCFAIVFASLLTGLTWSQQFEWVIKHQNNHNNSSSVTKILLIFFQFTMQLLQQQYLLHTHHSSWMTLKKKNCVWRKRRKKIQHPKMQRVKHSLWSVQTFQGVLRSSGLSRDTRKTLENIHPVHDWLNLKMSWSKMNTITCYAAQSLSHGSC